jgi:anaerobic selenocysteine-containing dehydrogenase
MLHHRTCHLCEAMCGIAITVDGDRITAIRGDADDPFSRGHICPKAVALQDVQGDPDRLTHPVRRTAGGWQRLSWDEAFDEAAARIQAVQGAHGRDAMALYVGNPTVHNHGALLFGGLLSRALRTRHRFSATSVDQLPHHLAAYLMYGHQLLLPVPDLDRTRFLLVLGANPVVSNGSLMTAPDVARRLKAIRARGGRLVVVDPRRSETAAMADEHLFIRPGTDVLLLLALLHTLVAEERIAPGRLEAFTDGWDVLARAVEPFAPGRVAAATGIAADRLRGLARQFAASAPAVCYGRVGVSTQAFGGLCQWLIQALNIATGNLDRAGGAMFTRPAFDLVEQTARRRQQGHFATRRTRVRQLPNFGGEFPVAALAEEILTPGDGQIRGLLTSAGNPVLSTPNGRQLDRALATLDAMVAIDFYINETTRHAHVILPPTFALEHAHYDVVFHTLAIRNTAKYSPPLFAPAPGARHDWQILLELATRLNRRGVKNSVVAGVTRAVMGTLGPDAMLAWALRQGPYGAGWRPWGGLTLRALKRARHGVDLGPLAPCLPERLFTRDRRIDLAPAVFLADLARVEATLLGGGETAVRGSPGLKTRGSGSAEKARGSGSDDPPPRGSEDPRGSADPRGSQDAPLVLIGRRELRSNNSWMHNCERLVKGPRRCTLQMHPADAGARGLGEGDTARVTSRVGHVEVPVEVTDEMMPGVVSLPHGWGHGRPGVLQRVATRDPGASINDLTDDQALDALCGTAAFSGVAVTVGRWLEA